MLCSRSTRTTIHNYLQISFYCWRLKFYWCVWVQSSWRSASETEADVLHDCRKKAGIRSQGGRPYAVIPRQQVQV